MGQAENLKRPRLEEEAESYENLRVEDSYDNDNDNQKDTDHVQDNKPVADEFNKKKQRSFLRVWTEQQEIAILNGFIKFSTEKGLDPFAHKTQFFNFMKDSPEFVGDVSFTRSQLFKKLKKMHAKFKSNVVKGKATSDPHQDKFHELSAKIWGTNNTPDTGHQNQHQHQRPDLSLLYRNGNANEQVTASTVDLDEKFGGLGEDIVEQVMAQIGEDERAEFKKQWNQLQILELELSLKRAQLVEFETNIILEAFKSSRNKMTE